MLRAIFKNGLFPTMSGLATKQKETTTVNGSDMIEI
jgi:hypothetical protein